VTPLGRYVWGGYYERDTLIWRSRFLTDDGATVECREALALPAARDRAVILRRVVALHGTADVRVTLDARAAFGAESLRGAARDDAGCWRGRLGAFHLAVAGAARAEATAHGRGGTALGLDLRLEQGEQHDLVLVLATSEEAVPDADDAWAHTEKAWAQRVPDLAVPVGERDARHAYAVMSGLTSAGGGMVAAATTALPERARAGRSYDYRYAWIRDQCYAGQAVARAGPYPLLDDAVRFVGERLLEDGPTLRPAYTIDGGRVPDQRDLDLPGYPGGAVVVGNHVNEQFQLDVFGEALLLFAAAHAHDRLDGDGWRAAAKACTAIEARWREPDAGIWELEPAEWTQSRLAAAAGLRALARCRPAGERAERWLHLADAITADASSRMVHPDGRWQRSPDDGRVDAALLMAAIRGAIPADDPRSRATLAAVGDELVEDGYVYRYRPDGRPLGEAEGAFLLCGFMLSLAHAQRGEAVAAARWFERNRAACGPPGLLSEEFDVTQRQLRGNLPQAFVHALLLECAASAR
jgi:GH15 family glucan-1,4-alpha-glucosidase